MKKNKINYSEFNSIKNFKSNIDKTLNLINSINGNIETTKIAIKTISKTKGHEDAKKYLEKININEEDMGNIYELGYTSMYSNFEIFMYDFLKELYSKFPQNIDTEKSMKIGEIYNLKSKKQLRDYIQDTLAMENSFSLNSWIKYIDEKFKIKCFKNNNHCEYICLCNEIRNILVHSGGMINYKFAKEVKKYLKINIPVNTKFKLIKTQGKRYLDSLHNALNLIINAIVDSN